MSRPRAGPAGAWTDCQDPRARRTAAIRTPAQTAPVSTPLRISLPGRVSPDTAHARSPQPGLRPVAGLRRARASPAVRSARRLRQYEKAASRRREAQPGDLSGAQRQPRHGQHDRVAMAVVGAVAVAAGQGRAQMIGGHRARQAQSPAPSRRDRYGRRNSGYARPRAGIAAGTAAQAATTGPGRPPTVQPRMPDGFRAHFLSPHGKRIRNRVRFWERNGSGGTLLAAVRSGQPTRLDAADVRERRAAAALLRSALSSHRGGQGFKSPQLHPSFTRSSGLFELLPEIAVATLRGQRGAPSPGAGRGRGGVNCGR